MRGIGYFLGSIFGAAAVFFIISYVFLRPRDVEESQVKEFIQNSDKILITDPIPLHTEFRKSDPRLGRETLTKTTYFSNRNMTYIYADTYSYFSKELNKYVRTYYFTSNGADINGRILDFGDEDKDPHIYPDLYFYYNKTQNEDKTYGTIDKPLPILFFVSSDPSRRTFWYKDVKKEKDKKLMDAIYENNVKAYLAYFIEKEDFKKLFPEK
ncbi:hypothetical protein [Chryseobacterium sp. CT-SW4]|uniref:hypothetical protein n=1 Tax=Chryseobacterium sp. SW-1 TaxID=3157343 RepID=UPI003B022906